MLDVYEQKHYNELVVTHVAARAALIVIGKYYFLTNDGKALHISISNQSIYYVIPSIN